MERTPVGELRPGDRIWLSRRVPGVLGSRDRQIIVAETPCPVGESVTFPAWEARFGQFGFARIVVCAAATADFEAVSV